MGEAEPTRRADDLAPLVDLLHDRALTGPVRDRRPVYVDLLPPAKYLLAGADVVMTASALIRHGPNHARVMLDGLSNWMSRMGFSSVAEVRGLLSVPASADEAAQERSGYVTALQAADLGYGPW